MSGEQIVSQHFILGVIADKYICKRRRCKSHISISRKQLKYLADVIINLCRIFILLIRVYTCVIGFIINHQHRSRYLRYRAACIYVFQRSIQFFQNRYVLFYDKNHRRFRRIVVNPVCSVLIVFPCKIIITASESLRSMNTPSDSYIFCIYRIIANKALFHSLLRLTTETLNCTGEQKYDFVPSISRFCYKS